VQALEDDGTGRVLVVDGGGSHRCALLGDNIAEMGYKNGWSVSCTSLAHRRPISSVADVSVQTAIRDCCHELAPHMLSTCSGTGSIKWKH